MKLPLSYQLPAAVSLPFVESVRESFGTGKWLTFILVGTILGVFACWLSSILFAVKKASVSRALLTYGAYLVLTIATVIFLSLGLPFVMQTRDPMRLLVFTCGVGLLVLVLSVAIPMKIYEIGSLRSLGLCLTAMVVGFGLNVALQIALFGGEVPLEQAPVVQLFKRVVEFNPPDRATRAAELVSRRDELVRRHEQLSIRYKHMTLRPAEVRDYLQEREHYARDLAEYQRDAAAFARE